VIGPIRQELLSGLRTVEMFGKVRDRLRDFPDELLTTADFEQAAESHNRCRQSGVSGSAVDFLICAAALRRGLAVFTTDGDFAHYARVLGVRLHTPAARTG
jgi:predicted nucleic acid-binding protein